MPDDVGGRRRDPPARETPENEPPNPTWLYESDPAPAGDRPDAGGGVADRALA